MRRRTFDAEQFALFFPARYLNQRLPVADDELRRLLQKQITLLEERYGNDFPEQLRSVLRLAITGGRADASHVAKLFGMHSRTLHRRLKAFGLGFQQVVDEIRFEAARQMLEGSTMDVARIADFLNYAAPGAFTRAFRRWSGTTPAEWRAAHNNRSMLSQKFA